MRTALVRLSITVSVIAATLAPAWSAPVRTITLPETLARSVHASSEHHRRVELGYPATHIAFSWQGPAGSAVRYRTVSETGETSGWARAPEVHGPRWAERRGRHFSAVLGVGRVVEVEWAGVGRRAHAIERITLDYLNTVDGPRREVQIPRVAGASDAPQVVTRAQWGADESLRKNRNCSRSFHRLRQIFVHHTAGKNYDSNPRSTMRAIYWYHVVRQGWCDIGYNFVIGADGTIFEGRWARRYKPWELHDGETASGRVVAGAHTGGYNSGSLGVSLMGNYSQIPLPPSARRSLVELLAWEVDRHGLKPRGKHTFNSRTLNRIAGHRDAGSTACPGSYVYKQLPAIRREVEAARGRGRASSTIALAAPSSAVTYGEPATFTGTLATAHDEPLVGRQVSSYVKEGARRWRLGPGSVTDESGGYSLEVDVRRNTKVIAVYEGDALTWGAQSPVARARVAPLVTIEALDGDANPAGVSHYPSGTGEVVLAGEVVPAHVHQSVRVRVSRLEGSEYQVVERGVAELDNASAYSYRFLVDEEGGTYQAIALFSADEDHARARSEPVTFVVAP